MIGVCTAEGQQSGVSFVSCRSKVVLELTPLVPGHFIMNKVVPLQVEAYTYLIQEGIVRQL
jgi:hypothetical protein